MRIILFQSSNFLICEFALLFARDDERKPKAAEMTFIRRKTKVNHPPATSTSKKKSRPTRDTARKCYAESPGENEDDDVEEEDDVIAEEKEDDDVIDVGDDAIAGVDVDEMIGEENRQQDIKWVFMSFECSTFHFSNCWTFNFSH